MRDYKRGSEWRKWDLHVHTTSSFDAYKGEDADELLVRKLKENDIAAVAITDHFLIHEEHITKLRNLAPEITFFPGVELRTDKGADNLHIILIFSEKRDLVTLQSEFDIRMIKDKAKCIDNAELAHWSYDDIIEFAHQTGALVTIHAGKKENGLDREITNATPIKQAIKKEIAEGVHFFEVGKKSDIDDYYKHVFKVINEKPIIMCSDNHDPRAYTTKENLWIKAEPTFEGLIQCIYHPQERVFVGNLPPKLDKIEKNKRFYIDSFEVKKRAAAKNKGEWFDFNLPINSGLSAIIGNKGSGKSALSDILGHLCYCGSMKDASFLNENRFRKLPKRLANDYEANIVWLDGQIDEVNSLGGHEKTSQFDNAQYLPQKYIESICNELDNEFQKEINNVIFSYIDSTQKGDAKNLDELIDNKTASLGIKENEVKIELADVNKRIITTEQMLTTEYLNNLNTSLKKKQDDLQRHIKNKPQEVVKPDVEPSEEYTKSLNLLVADISQVEIQIKETISELTKTNSHIVTLEEILERLSILTENIDRFNIDLREIAAQFDFSNETLKVLYTSPSSIIEKKLKILKENRDEKQVLVDLTEEAKEETSLYKKLQNLVNKKEVLVSKTDSKEKAYQKYLNDLKEWEDGTQKIIGNIKTADSVEYIKNEIKHIQKKLPDEYKDLKQKRLAIIKKLFDLKIQKVNIYKTIYDPVEKQLDSLLTDIEDDFEFAVNISMIEKDAPIRLLNFIDKTFIGKFQSKDGAQNKMNEIFRSCNFNNFQSVSVFFNSIIECVYENMDSSSKIVKDKEGFYNYLTSLNYMNVEYNLKMNGKNLEELSAGERGSILLMFYLALSKKEIPIIIDQPEDNLDNQSVFNKLVPYILHAKKRRQIIIVTHNPNIAIACDAEQIIYCSIDKKSNKITYESGSIENEVIRDKVINVLEGTMPAFTLRRLKYTLDTKV